jgi:hypothetical protein
MVLSLPREFHHYISGIIFRTKIENLRIVNIYTYRFMYFFPMSDLFAVLKL